MNPFIFQEYAMVTHSYKKKFLWWAVAFSLLAGLSLKRLIKKEEKQTKVIYVGNKLRHLACIMDGNRRWAHACNLQPCQGHKKGAEVMRTVIDFCLKSGIPYLSLFGFSLENFKRSEEEKKYLFDLAAQETEQLREELVHKGVRISFVGDRSMFPDTLRTTVERTEASTREGDRLHINILFCYGSTQEIVNAAKRLAYKIEKKEITAEQVNEMELRKCLWMDPAIPDPDLIIRTGKEWRLSNFLLYQAAYSEYAFLDCFWPEVTEAQLVQTVEEYTKRKRRYGN